MVPVRSRALRDVSGDARWRCSRQTRARKYRSLAFMRDPGRRGGFARSRRAELPTLSPTAPLVCWGPAPCTKRGQLRRALFPCRARVALRCLVGSLVRFFVYFALRDRRRFVTPAPPPDRRWNNAPINRGSVPARSERAKRRLRVARPDRGTLKGAMFRSGGTRLVAYPRLVHGDGPSASRVAVGEGWVSRTGVRSKTRYSPGPGIIRILTTRQ